MTTATPHPQCERPVIEDPVKAQEKNSRTQTMFDEYTVQLGDARSLPQYTILTEKPIHTAVAYMLAAGKARKEIAVASGLGEATISSLMAQPWFRKRLKEIADAAGTDMVKAFLDGEVLPSLEILRSIARDPTEKGATRVSAVNSILDRGLGKPVAFVESKTTLNIHTAADAADQVQSELEKIDRELQDRGVKMILRGN
jgi:hypothetical protein